MSRPVTATNTNTFTDTINISNSIFSSRPNTADYGSLNQKKNKRNHNVNNASSSIPGRYPDRKAKRTFKKPSFGCSSKRFECSTTNLPGTIITIL